MKYKENFSQILKKIRNEKKISQKQLADIMNISPSMVTKYESGINTPSLPNLLKLVDFYNLDLNTFIENSEEINFKKSLFHISPPSMDDNYKKKKKILNDILKKHIKLPGYSERLILEFMIFSYFDIDFIDEDTVKIRRATFINDKVLKNVFILSRSKFIDIIYFLSSSLCTTIENSFIYFRDNDKTFYNPPVEEIED